MFDPYSPPPIEPKIRREAQIKKIVSEQTVFKDVPIDLVEDRARILATTYLLGLTESHKVIRQSVEFRGAVAVDRRVEKSWSDRHLPTFKRLLGKTVAPDFETVEVPVVGYGDVEIEVDMAKFFPEWTNEMGLVLYEEVTRSRVIEWYQGFDLLRVDQ